MFTRRTIPLIIGSIILVAVAFLFLIRALDWTYVSELYKDEPDVVIEPPVEVIKQVELEVSVWLSDEGYLQILEISDQISKRLPNFDVTITNYADQFTSYADWEKAMQLGELGDLQLVPNEWVTPLAVKGLHQPIDRLLNNDILSDQFVSIVDAFKWNGYLWAIPYEINPYIILIRQTAYEALVSKQEEAGELTIAPAIRIEEPSANSNLEQIENNPVVKDLELKSIVSNELSTLTFDDWLRVYEELQLEDAFISIDPSEVASLLSWIVFFNSTKEESLSLNISDKTLEQLLILSDQADSMIASNDRVSQDAVTHPMLHIVTYQQFLEQQEELLEHYVVTKSQVPLPWMNGYSFMLSSKTKDEVSATEWLQEIHLHYPKGTFNHSKMYSKLSSNIMQSILSISFQQKLEHYQLFKVEHDLIQEYEVLKYKWNNYQSMKEKMDLFINQKESSE